MKSYKRQFIQFALEYGALRFGEFTLKSGRQSPYFFNTGLFNTGEKLALLGRFYAEALVDSALCYDTVFGLAYKGIPIVSATVVALAQYHNINVPYCFNRKEVKDHGEGGHLVGMPIDSKRVVLVDDVITAGTAIHQSSDILKTNNAQLVGVLVSFDRQERGHTERSAIQEIERSYQCEVISIITIDDVISFLHKSSTQSRQLEKIKRYREQYGVIQY